MPSSHRIACLVVPLFPLAARLRSEPELLDEAVAVLAGSGNGARVVAATRRARRHGIRPGLTLSQARARLPRLIARARDAVCEGAAQEALLDVAESLSPRVEDAGDGLAYLDADGLDRHYPGAEPERDFARSLVHAADRGAGLPVRVGVAGSKLAARMAAAQPRSPTVVAAGREADFLAPLPLAQLTPQAKTLDTLERWGVRTVGELARLPRAEVVSRLGPVGQELQSIAQGLDPRPLVPRPAPPSFVEGLALEWPLVQIEPFVFVSRAALERLTQRMAGQGLACQRLELALELEPDGRHDRSLTLPAPTRDVKTLVTLLRLDLEAHPPGAPIVAFRLTAHPDAPRRAQLSLFGPAALSPEKLATTLARLFALLGDDRVGSPRPVDDHRPERFALVPFAPPPPPPERRPPSPGRGLLSVRVLRPAVALEVLTEDDAGPDVAGARPVELRATVSDDAGRKIRIEGPVRIASGPWTLEEAWWTPEPAERDYWDVELVRGGLYRIYRDRRSRSWYVDGIYD